MPPWVHYFSHLVVFGSLAAMIAFSAWSAPIGFQDGEGFHRGGGTDLDDAELP